MKYFLFIGMLITAFPALSQERSEAKINIFTYDCRAPKSKRLYVKDTLWVYRQDTLIEKRTVARFEGNFRPIVISHLTMGTYKILFVNIFKERITKWVNVGDSAEYACYLCPDELNSMPMNTLARLKVGESITIDFGISSCFGEQNERIDITRKKGFMLASLKNDGRIHIVRLSPKMQADFIRFENELRSFNGPGGCTTRNHYIMRSKYGKIEKDDKSCSWGGFYFLKSSFLGVSIEEYW